MLGSDDRALVERDPQVPGLSVVLDPDAVLALAAEGGTRAVAARPTYVRYKPATSCVVGYELTTAEGPLLAAAKAHAPHAAAKIGKAIATGGRDHGMSVLTCAEHLVVLAPAASDRAVPALGALADPPRRERLLRRLVPDHPAAWHDEPRAIRYKPTRRWVGLVEHDGIPVAVIKAYRRGDVRRARALQRQFAPPAARPLRWSEHRAAVASSWLPGTTLAMRLQAYPDSGVDGVGAALATLHAATPAGDVGVGGRRVDAALDPSAAAVAHVLPHLESRARRLATALHDALATGEVDGRVIHGDFSADQVVVAGIDVRLIDFDQAHVADPALDLASFGAGLFRAELEGRLLPGRAGELLADLVAEHAHAGGPRVDDRLPAHLAAALLRLAIAPFRERQHGWAARGESLLAAAEGAAAAAPRVGGRP